ncbi:MAG: NAD(+) diphosphatase [Gammaproteobacteria bacterium CG_4_10_14_0_8_um_filter_38_16]|nr:MAG: NAD(+) diphosphatase [Gammaproteobacteria bacterium CG_4_10_14_0_8_um_filter_38_16]PJA03289.1 MAG: NAD(+) diphosphatase [Gammaproteobacteria bacterium CG_4_10_14_0_2_um_filter_38_22]PJB10334.1 MAG: NAD(+) diphosphatase [Gammaproteobacteria bacterium CG_4_9_14_3_um_filter_38_9]
MITKRFHTVSAPKPHDFIFAFEHQQIYLLHEKKIPQWHEVSHLFQSEQHFYCFAESNEACYLISEKNNIADSVDYIKTHLRTTGSLLEKNNFLLACRANHLDHWRKTHHYCGVCGHENKNKADEQALICSQCNHVSYPRISPCMIVLITHGKKILLARSPHFPINVYSTLAGFVEPGESLEETVHREIFEEVGLRVSNLKYVRSQPWPFPDSLMVGFTAEYLSGEIHIDEKEIEDAQWFDMDSLPTLPPLMSIGRELIDTYVAQFK